MGKEGNEDGKKLLHDDLWGATHSPASAAVGVPVGTPERREHTDR
jgi:hypothetical protein